MSVNDALHISLLTTLIKLNNIKSSPVCACVHACAFVDICLCVRQRGCVLVCLK